MRNPAAYKVIITTSLGLNIILTNKKEANFRSFSHFVTAADAESFSINLAKTLESGTYTELERCPICGQVFTRQHRLTLLKDGRIIHGKCYWAAIGRREMTGYEHEKRCYYLFAKDAPEFDFSNIGNETESKSFRYAIQIVSKQVIHLYLIEPYHYMKHHFCLTYDECKGLIHEINANLERLKQYQDAAVGKCALCGHPIYADKNRYQLDSGEMIHGTCMERFIRSEASAKVRFPAQLICRKDVFGHAQIFGEPFDPSLFPDVD